MRLKTVLTALILLAVSGIAGPSDAASVYIKKKPGEENQTVQPVVPPSAALGQQPLPGSLPGAALHDAPPCTPEDAKLISQIDRKILADPSDSFDPEDTIAESREWQSNLKNKESINNLIDLYFRCAFVIMQQRQAMGKGPGKTSRQP